jgi:hypothetical protein
MSEEAPEYRIMPAVATRKRAPRQTKQQKAEPKKVSLPPAAERELPAPVPLARWASDDIRRAELADVLRSPIIQEALSTLRASYESEIPPLVSGKAGAVSIPNATDLNNLLALRSSHRAGFFGAFNALENLTREKVLRRSNTNPWGDLVPE